MEEERRSDSPAPLTTRISSIRRGPIIASIMVSYTSNLPRNDIGNSLGPVSDYEHPAPLSWRWDSRNSVRLSGRSSRQVLWKSARWRGRTSGFQACGVHFQRYVVPPKLKLAMSFEPLSRFVANLGFSPHHYCAGHGVNVPLTHEPWQMQSPSTAYCTGLNYCTYYGPMFLVELQYHRPQIHLKIIFVSIYA